nr:hypothetical protein [Allomuricauda sp.]
MKTINKSRVIIALVVFSVIMFNSSCSKGDDEPGGGPGPDNEVPVKAAKLEFPTNDLVCTNFNLEFRWSDSNTGTITQEIEVSKDNGFSTPVFQEAVSGNTKVYTLERNTTYYWRIITKRSGSEQRATSEVWKFVTEPEATTNSVPYQPTVVSPANEATVVGATADLTWTGEDPDNDVLTYDIYFGTSNPPALLASGISETNRTVDLQGAGTYYWRIVVRDDKQSAAVGPVWNFKID